jgi:hypothetical protein
MEFIYANLLGALISGILSLIVLFKTWVGMVIVFGVSFSEGTGNSNSDKKTIFILSSIYLVYHALIFGLCYLVGISPWVILCIIKVFIIAIHYYLSYQNDRYWKN